MKTAKLRIFQLQRDEDISGVSGVGRVAIGLIFPSGKAVLEWLGPASTFEIFDKLKHVEKIHERGVKRIVFVEDDCRCNAQAIQSVALFPLATSQIREFNRGSLRKNPAIVRGCGSKGDQSDSISITCCQT